MKQLVIFSLVMIFLLQGIMKVTIVAYYQMNKQYIAAVLCENKAKPEKQCNGRCYLDKKLKAEEKKEQKFPAMVKVLENFSLYCTECLSFQSVSQFLLDISVGSFYVLKQYPSPLSCIFQPPK